MSKTVTFRKTLNGNFVTSVEGIRGQQSSESFVYVFNSDLVYLKTVEAHPYFSWVQSCEKLATIYCNNNIEELTELLKIIVENNVSGYTTAFNLRNGKYMRLLPPLNTL